MRSLEFLFGKKKRGGASISDRLSYSAKGHLDRKILKNPINSWWIVLLRRYLLWPLLKIPLLPVVEAMEIRKKLGAFDQAITTLSEVGLKANYSFSGLLKSIQEKKVPFRKAFLRISRAIFWKPYIYLPKDLKIRDHICNFVVGEKTLSLKLFLTACGLWSLSLGFYLFSCYSLLQEGFGPLIRDWERLFGSQSLFYLFESGASHAFKLWWISIFFWSLSLVVSYLLTSRPWIKKTAHLEQFLRDFGMLKLGESDIPATLLALDDMVYISIQGLSAGKFRALRYGWPNGFMPGEIIESTKSTDDIVILMRPERKAIVFSGEHARSDILTNIKAYDKHIIGPMKAAMISPLSEEQIFVGEVIDSRWWQSSQLYLGLGNAPHVAVIGQTRSGKTMSVLSFIYSFARAYPDTIWFYADGKGSPDYDPFAEALSVFPVAKTQTDNQMEDSLIQLANIIDAVWTEYSRRRNLFDKAKLEGKPCSSIYMYRNLVGPLPQLWLVIDEFSTFFNEMDFMRNHDLKGTIAYRIKKIASEAAYTGIHLLLASQRYQATDLPTNVRNNLTTMLIHNVQDKESEFLKVPEAKNLDKGQFLVSGPGLFCRHTGISRVKAKLPFVGGNYKKLIAETLTPIDKKLKKDFDPLLIYNKGSNDLETMGITELCMRFQRYFRDQNYLTTLLVDDFEATELQMDIVKSKRFIKKLKNGTNKYHLEQIEDAPKIGVSFLRAEEIDQDTLIRIQNSYKEYSAILVFVVGRSSGSTSKYKFVEKLNELGTRFYIVPFTEYSKDLRFVEMRRRQGIVVDVIKPKLDKLGLGNTDHTIAAKDIHASDLTSKSPMKFKLAKIIELIKLDKNQGSGDRMGIPYVTTILPAGTELHFLIVAGKQERDDAKDLANILMNEEKSVVIVSNEKFTQADLKYFESKNILFWRSLQVEEIISKLANGQKEVSRAFVSKLMKDLKIINQERGAKNVSPIKIGPKANLLLSSRISQDGERVLECKLSCEDTGYTIVSYSEMDIMHYRLEILGIPEGAKITVKTGMAPLGTKPENIVIRQDSKLHILPAKSSWEVVGGVLTRKKDKIDDDDPLLQEMTS